MTSAKPHLLVFSYIERRPKTSGLQVPLVQLMNSLDALGVPYKLRVVRKEGLQSSEDREFAPNEDTPRLVLLVASARQALRHMKAHWAHRTLLFLRDSQSLFYRTLSRAPIVDPWTRAKAMAKATLLTRVEKLLVRGFLGVVFVARRDAQHLRRLVSQAEANRVTWVPLGVNIGEPKLRPNWPGVPRFLFVGTLTYAPNLHALHILLEHIWPQVLRRTKGTPPTLTIVGPGTMPERLLRRARAQGVTVAGFVEDIVRVYRDHEILLAPVFFGSGSKNKVIEAMAEGLYVLATPEAMSGVPEELWRYVGLCRSPEDFTSHILYLLSELDSARELAYEGAYQIRQALDMAQVASRWGAVLDAALRTSDRRTPVVLPE